MSSFNITGIIEQFSLDREKVAEVLFPNCTFKKQALDRIIKGQAYLDTEQIQALATLAGVMVGDLFTLSNWRSSCNNGTLIFTKDEYTAKVNYNGTFLVLIKGTNVIAEELISNSMTISNFINHINKLCQQ